MTTSRLSSFAMASLSALAFTFGGAQSASAFGYYGSSGSSGSWGSSGSSGSWGSYGSSGSSGSYGSYGSSGSSGSYGSYGSSGSYGSYGSSGSSGSYGSSGSWGSYGSSGSWGSYGSDGSSGGYYVAGSVAPSAQSVAYLNVKVPADATVYLQNQLMTLTGTQRRFVTPELAQGQHFFTVRVEIQRNGQTISKTTKATVQAGQETEVVVSFDTPNANERVASVAPGTGR